MKCKIPEISWHNRDPVLSVDVQPKSERKSDEVLVYRLASGGTDAHVLIWYLQLNTETGVVDIELAADMSRHQRAVNAVKWSPNGELLASGDDESVIFIWKQKSESETLNMLENTNAEDKEIWLTMKILRGHMEDVYDLSWSPNSQLLVSGSVDNTAMIWDVHKGKSLAILSDHKGFVQGVAWDPLNKYIATLSTDRYLRIFEIQTKKVVYRINKSVLPVSEDHELHEKSCRLYHDDTLQTFYRRLTFTPDGKLLITPSGLVEYADFTHPLETSYIFSRYDLKQPAIVLPSPDQYTVAVRCCPTLFELRPHSEDYTPVVPLPYRMIFAVATRSSVYFYDTQQSQPFAVISNIHYTRLTDIAWSPDGRVVVVSSTDGFCSLICFSEGELGVEYSQTVADLLAQEQVLHNNNNNKMQKKKQNNKNKTANEPKSPQQNSPTTKTKASSATDEEKENSVEFIIDKEIISSAEKFDTPAKNTEKARPIEIRRRPRAPTELSARTKLEVPIMKDDDDALITDDEDLNSFDSEIQAKIIDGDQDIVSDECEIRSEVEEHSLIRMEKMEVEEENDKDQNDMEVDQNVNNEKVAAEKEEQEQIVEEITKSQVEEDKKESELKKSEKEEENAMESQIDNEKNKKNDSIKTVNENIESSNEVNETTDVSQILPDVEQKQQLSTDKIIMESPMSRPNYLSPSERTPRRVTLRTISTPKSKKKLID